MAISGNLYSTYLNTTYIPMVTSEIFWNQWWVNQPFFEVVQPGDARNCPGGSTINIVLDYAVSTNAEAYVQGAPMPTAHTLSDVRAYFNKDYYQEGGKVYGDTMSQLGGGGGNVPIDPQQKAIQTSIKNAVDLASTTMLTDLAGQVDSTTAYSDASLSRTTYSLASSETGSVGALARSDLIDMIERAQNTTYGFVPLDDLCFLMPPNQHTNVANLQGAAQYAEFVVNAQDMSPMDTGVKFRCQTFETVPILQVPDMTTTEIYLLRRSTTRFHLHEGIKTVPKDVAEWADYWLTTLGVNMVVADPVRSQKLTGVTA